jgi:hypothetical protein
VDEKYGLLPEEHSMAEVSLHVADLNIWISRKEINRRLE